MMHNHTKQFFPVPCLLLTALLLLFLSGCGTAGQAAQSSGSGWDIPPYISQSDMDGDGIDDQTDILQSTRAYLATKPKYESRYYAGGYPDDGYGVCTDVVIQALLGAGYNLKDAMDEDIRNRPQAYGISQPEPNIDFRRVVNQNVYFQTYAISLTRDFSDIAEWQGGDIVVFRNHIGIVSDRRDKDGVPYFLHHYSKWQRRYEQDTLRNWGEVVGHYRMS